METLLIVGGVAGLLAVVFLLVFWLQKKRAGEVLARFQGQKVYGVTSNANFFGQESLGPAQVRGNGVLVLVEGELYYEMWAPRRSLRIPFSSLRSVETVGRFLGKTKGRPLLKVTFVNEHGASDAAAWLIGRHEHWRAALEKVIAGAGPSG